MHFGRRTDVDGQKIIAQRWPSTADMDLGLHAADMDRYKDGSCITGWPSKIGGKPPKMDGENNGSKLY